MSGEHVRDDIALYALGLLEPDERAALERHLATCSACQADLAAEDATLESLAAAVSAEPPRDLRERIVARHRRRGRLAGWMPRPVAVAATLLAVLALAAIAAVEQVVPLEPRGTAGNAAAVVARGGSTYLVLALPAPRKGQAYEAWIIRDGSAIPAGLAREAQGVAVVALTVALLPGDVAAVTVERAEGVRAPTSDPILVGVRGRS